jgi:predicted DNA-binding ribbon-helix-helix protein
MQSLGDAAYTRLRRIADDRDITVQELIRAIVIPDWLKMAEKHNGEESQSERHRKRVSRSSARSAVVAMTAMQRQQKRKQ